MPAIVFTVNRTGDLTQPGSVDWLLQGSLQPADLGPGQASSGSVSWLANETTAKTITITTVGNTADNPDRACTVTLSNPVNATLGTAQATTTVVDDDAAPGVVTPAGYPYPRSDLWREVTFPNTLTRLLQSSDQHPTTPLADGTIIDVACDRTAPAAVYSTLQIVRLSGTYPNLVEDGRAMWGLGADARGGNENLKCHAIVSLIGNRLLLWYYRLNVNGGAARSCCVLSTDNGETFAALPAETAAVFTQNAADFFQPRGIIQPGPGYGNPGPPNTAPQWFDRDYIYLAGNNQTQGSVAANQTRKGGLIYCARYKFANTGGSTGGSLTMTNLNDRSRYSFYKGVNIDGVPQWTANGGLKTEAGVVPLFNNTIDGVLNGVGYYWNCHWHPAINQWVAIWLPNGLTGVSIAHAPTLWGNKWRMLANNVPVTRLNSLERGYYLAASIPAAWSSASKLGLGLSTYVEQGGLPENTAQPGDNLILTDSTPLVAL